MILPGRYEAGELHAFVVRALRAAGAGPEDAALTAESLVAADLRGVHSHGVVRAGIYVDRLRAGSINPRAELAISRDHGALVVVDAQAGLGVPMAARAMDLAIARAREHGVGVVGVRNGNHCGMMAFLAMRALPDAVGIALSNADALLAPWGARTRFLGTNPIAIAAPGRGERPIVLDMATSVVAHGKVKGALDRGQAIPSGWAIGPDGAVTTDPGLALAGALLPFGTYKGSGLCLLIDVLAGLLPGGPASPEVVPLYQRFGEPQQVGHLFIALRIEAFGASEAFRRGVDDIAQRVRTLPPLPGCERPLLPGEIEAECAERSAVDGIALPRDAVAEMARIASLFGVEVARPT